MTKIDDLKRHYMQRGGYICRTNESPTEAFDRLRIQDPNFLPVPVPCADASLWETIKATIHSLLGPT